MTIPGAIDSLFYAKQSGSYTVMIVDSGCPEHSQGINVYFAVGLAEQPPKKLPLYPNPTTGILTIKGVEGTIAVYNIYGERIATILSTTTDPPASCHRHLFCKGAGWARQAIYGQGFEGIATSQIPT